MAFDFLGTLTIKQLQELRSFIEAQIVDIDEEINFLYMEEANLRQTLASFEKADSHFGGDISTYLYASELPDVIRMPKQEDSAAADLMYKIKKPFVSTIKYKLEKNEFKIKKIFDAIEQTKEQIDRKAIAKSQSKALLNELESMFSNDNSSFLFKTEEEKRNFFKGIPI